MKPHNLLPEWAPQKAIMLAWPSPKSDWQYTYKNVIACYWNMLDEFSQHIETWVLLHPDLSIKSYRKELMLSVKKPSNVVVFNDINYDDTWIRDYGPLSTLRHWISPLFNGWGDKYKAENDNQVAQELAQRTSTPIKQLSWVAEGGALEVNGLGVLLANKNCLCDPARNPNLSLDDIGGLLLTDMGITAVEWLNDICLSGDDTDGHIDTLARFVNDNKIVYCGPNHQHHDSAMLHLLESQLCDIATRRQWDLVALPTPIVRSVVDDHILPTTYTNFLISRRKADGSQRVFVPVYGIKEDDQALSVLADCFPGSAIVAIDCAALLEQHGSLHCATMQVTDIGAIEKK